MVNRREFLGAMLAAPVAVMAAGVGSAASTVPVAPPGALWSYLKLTDATRILWQTFSYQAIRHIDGHAIDVEEYAVKITAGLRDDDLRHVACAEEINGEIWLHVISPDWHPEPVIMRRHCELALRAFKKLDVFSRL